MGEYVVGGQNIAANVFLEDFLKKDFYWRDSCTLCWAGGIRVFGHSPTGVKFNKDVEHDCSCARDLNAAYEQTVPTLDEPVKGFMIPSHAVGIVVWEQKSWLQTDQPGTKICIACHALEALTVLKEEHQQSPHIFGIHCAAQAMQLAAGKNLQFAHL